MNKNVKHNGAVFTPPYIAKFMSSFIDDAKSKTILEPSCGEGSLLHYISKQHNVLGIDLQKKYVNECRKKFPEWTFIQKDFTSVKLHQKFDYIIGNPPYVKIQNLPKHTVTRIVSEYPKFMHGNINLYAYFIIKCLGLLADKGKLIFIIPNTLFFNKSLRSLKQYLLDQRLLEHLVDFGDEQIFEHVLTYTCIIVLSKRKKDFYMSQKGLNGKPKKISYNTTRSVSDQQIFSPRIGIMTLADSIYILKKWKSDGKYIKFNDEAEKPYRIEKKACRNIFKVSKNEIHKIIYPYILVDSKVVPDSKFASKYPLCYKYLVDHKNILALRDSGKYPLWFCYGRTQSLMPYHGNRLFISTVVHDIKDSLITKDIELYYAGLWIKPVATKSIESLKNMLIKNEDLILQQSNHRDGGWFALSHGSFAGVIS